jgi:hypothetical protein
MQDLSMMTAFSLMILGVIFGDPTIIFAGVVFALLTLGISSGREG